MKPDRRSFLTASAAAAAASLLGGARAAAATPANRGRTKLAVATYSYWHFKTAKVPVETVMDRAAELGAEGVDILHRQMEIGERAPLDAAGRARIDASADGIMEQEIAYAKNAGLNYWAFLTYPEGDAMSSALARYLRSPKRADLGFCLILHQTLSVPAARWPAERDRVIKLLQEPGYQNVGTRPLVFAFDLKTEHPTVQARLGELRASAKSAGSRPYEAMNGSIRSRLRSESISQP